MDPISWHFHIFTPSFFCNLDCTRTDKINCITWNDLNVSKKQPSQMRGKASMNEAVKVLLEFYRRLLKVLSGVFHAENTGLQRCHCPRSSLAPNTSTQRDPATCSSFEESSSSSAELARKLLVSSFVDNLAPAPNRLRAAINLPHHLCSAVPAISEAESTQPSSEHAQ